MIGGCWVNRGSVNFLHACAPPRGSPCSSRGTSIYKQTALSGLGVFKQMSTFYWGEGRSSVGWLGRKLGLIQTSYVHEWI